MAGTRIGGLKAAATNKEKHGEDFYKKLGRMGGLVSSTGGFASMPKEQVKAAGSKGGSKSIRGSAAAARERRARIVQLWKSGSTLSEIAEKEGCSRAAVAYHLRKESEKDYV